MPRFPVNFRRKSTAAEDHNGLAPEPSFRVLERPNPDNAKAFDPAVRLSKSGHASKPPMPDLSMEDNLFAGLNSSRGSGSSNTTKTGSDISSRHSNASMTPSAEYAPPQEDWRNSNSRRLLPQADNFIAPVPPIPPVAAHKSGGFLKQAGRTFSFGGSKKNASPAMQSPESVPPVPELKAPATPGGRSRATTASTVTATTPNRDWNNGPAPKFDKRSSVATLKERDSANGRLNHSSPLHEDHSSAIHHQPQAWNNQHSDEGSLDDDSMYPLPIDPDLIEHPVLAAAPPEPNNESPERRVSVDDSEDTTLLSDLTAASRFLSNEEADEIPVRSPQSAGMNGSYTQSSRYSAGRVDNDIFDESHGRPRAAPRVITSRDGNKVMTPQEFEKYRQNKVKEERLGYKDRGDSDREDEDINYDDEEDDEVEMSKRLQKQRRKQEAHLSVYRQQMMKVTGETGNPSTRPAMSMSMSLGNLNSAPGSGLGSGNVTSPPSDGSDDDEIPLAILAAHGFPNKNRPPTRLSTMGSQPNLKAAAQRPMSICGASVAGDGAPAAAAAAAVAASGGRLPPFARKLPQDPYLGAGLINQPPRESLALGGGQPAQSRPLPTGGLIGVIANEERARALRRGSPAVDHAKNGMQMNQGFDPVAGIPPQMMYPMSMQPPQAPMLSAGDHAQLQMNQNMHQFMQMQMQFMQMMASQTPSSPQTGGPAHPMGHASRASAGQLSDITRNAYLGGDATRNSMMGADAPRSSFINAPMSGGMGPSLNLDVPQAPPQIRTMSMVQPSSASWIQPPPPVNAAPSIHLQGGGYAPSIAPSERSNVGLPGRYRPVSSITFDKFGRTATMGASAHHARSSLQADPMVLSVNKDDDDDDDEGWAAMKSKRDQKKSIWRSRKSLGADIRALIN